MDINLVSRFNFSTFLNETGYKPQDPHNFLRGWSISDDGVYSYPNGTEDVPVTSVTV
jgi:hypothetical protein